MEVWIARYTPLVSKMFSSYNKAVISAGDYWSMLEKQHAPVIVQYFKDTIYDNLEGNRAAARLRRPWCKCRGKVVWKDGKPVGIHQFIGRRPVACFGNSDGDKAMLEYTTIANPRPSFGLIVHPTDADREYAYDAKPKSSGKLVEALADAPKRGWIVVDMKKDWKAIFPS